MGFQTTGTASEFFAVDASKVTPIPEEMSYEEGAMIEPLAVAVHGVKQVGDVKGMNIAVLGAGPIGNLVAQAAKGMGVEVNIKALPVAECKNVIDTVDIVLLGPQVRFQKPQIEAMANGRIPVEVIDMRFYGTMNGKGVLESALELIK